MPDRVVIYKSSFLRTDIIFHYRGSNVDMGMLADKEPDQGMSKNGAQTSANSALWGAMTLRLNLGIGELTPFDALAVRL
jgi:hypothetical protein